MIDARVVKPDKFESHEQIKAGSFTWSRSTQGSGRTWDLFRFLQYAIRHLIGRNKTETDNESTTILASIFLITNRLIDSVGASLTIYVRELQLDPLWNGERPHAIKPYTTINIIVSVSAKVGNVQLPGFSSSPVCWWGLRDHSHGPRHGKEQLYPHLWPREKTYVLESTEEGRWVSAAIAPINLLL